VGRYPGGILRRNVRTKRTKRTKCPRTGFRRGGSVRLESLMPPLFELKGDGTTALQENHDGLPPRPGRSGQVVLPSCQRAFYLKRSPGRTPAHRASHLLTLRSVARRGNTEWKAWSISFVEQCTAYEAERGCSAEGARRTRAFRKLVAAARNPRFGAKPGSAVAVRRRRNMNCYFHSSTVCRMRRETLRVFFHLGSGAHA
jgi:hypothetical protein